jgi:hypothetical protein
MAADFANTFAILRGMLKGQAARLIVTTDTSTDFMVASAEKKDRIGRPLFVAGVQIRKNYVSYHLMPVYMMPSLLKTLSPELKNRKQGKGCFNFKTIEPGMVKELSKLTKIGIAKFRTVALPWERR